MNDDTLRPEDITKSQPLQAGQYWRAKKEIREEAIESGEVLLINSIRWIDNEAHTIILRTHPSKFGKYVPILTFGEDGDIVSTSHSKLEEHRFLVQDFLARFEYEPDYKRVRRAEIQAIQGKISRLQTELLETQSNPRLLISLIADDVRSLEDKRIEKERADCKRHGEAPPDPVDPGAPIMSVATVADALGAGITTESIASMRRSAHHEHQIATAQANWITGKTEEIGEQIRALTPFYEEQAATALAYTEDVRESVERMLKGIESLDLYIGKDVEVETIRTGAPAPKGEPLTFVQKKLMMDEELAVWSDDVNHNFDARSTKIFKDSLRKSDGLVRQIFPTDRCVVVMATTRRFIDYHDEWANMRRNEENRVVFLLIRNGENIHRVYSPVESHLGARRLFPSKSDAAGIFEGIDGATINFKNVQYTDRVKDHDAFALHYKRFLLLVCGLDHRMKLFGNFYDGPPSLHFVSLDFQRKHCRFIHDADGEGMLPTEIRPPSSKWIESKNEFLRSGSRVLCNWSALMNPKTAPSACKENRDRRDYGRQYHADYFPKNSFDVCIAYKSGTDLCVDIPVHGKTVYKYEDRTFSCKVNLTLFKNHEWDNTELPYLCLDSLDPRDLDWYIHNRDSRHDFVYFIRFFKTALRFVQAECQTEADSRARMAEALAQGSIAEGSAAVEIVDRAVVAWRASHRGAPLPKFPGNADEWKSVLGQMYILAGEGAKRVSIIESFVRNGLGYEPLRLVLSGKNALLVVYAAPTIAERDDRLTDHAWVHRITVKMGEKQYREINRRWAVFPKLSVAETTIHEWPTAKDWTTHESLFPSLTKKAEWMDECAKFADRLKFFQNTLSAEEFIRLREGWENTRGVIQRGRYVSAPAIAIPFGMVKAGSGQLCFLCVGSGDAHGVVARMAPTDDERSELAQAFIRKYANRNYAEKTFKQAMTSGWELLIVSADKYSTRHFPFSDPRPICSCSGKIAHNPLIGDWVRNYLDKKQANSDADRKRKTWFADGVYYADGKCALDDLLGIRLPDGYAPVKVVTVELDGPTNSAYRKWVDIFPAPPEYDGTFSPFIERDDTDRLVKGIHETGNSMRMGHDISPSAARSELTRKFGDQVALSTTLSDAPPPPEGVERWIFVNSKPDDMLP